MAGNPKETLERINTVTSAWETLRADKTFSGLTLAQFKAKMKPSLDARAAITTLDHQMTAAQDARGAADDVAMATIQLVVSAVKGDPAEGDNGDLYEAMGYKRRDERSSGLHRKPPTPPPAA